MEDDVWWKMKFDLLQQEYEAVKRRNEELEGRMLNLVEHIELNKQAADEKIERLTKELSAATNKATFLENECARYRKDCIFAVHLLRCQPSRYVASQTAPGFSSSEKKTQVVKGIATFPPMAIYLPAEKLDETIEEENPQGSVETSNSELYGMECSPSFTSQFIEKINHDKDYNCVQLGKCEECSNIVTVVSRETQTPILENSRSRILNMDEIPFVGK